MNKCFLVYFQRAADDAPQGMPLTQPVAPASYPPAQPAYPPGQPAYPPAQPMYPQPGMGPQGAYPPPQPPPYNAVANPYPYGQPQPQ